MAHQATEDEKVEMFMMVGAELGATREFAVKYLQCFGPDVNDAVSAFIDGKPLPQENTSYDESAWMQDRYGGYEQEPNFPSYHIDHADNLPSYPHSTAPTRPPSRTSQVGTWGGASAGSGNLFGTLDEECAKQESGVVGSTTDAYFGPPKTAEDVTRNWTVATFTDTAELVPDVEAPHRVREYGMVGFLKPLPSGDYLPSLLTILATIPLTKQRLLLEPFTFPEYSHGKDWWLGENVSAPRVVSADEERINGLNYTEVDLITETHRLMALLVSSNRLYGSAKILAESERIDHYLYADDPRTHLLSGRFMECWHRAAEDFRKSSQQSEPPNLFKTTYVEKMNPDADETEMDVWTLSLTAEDLQKDEPPHSLYDALDSLLWSHDTEGAEKYSAWIRTPPPILTIFAQLADQNGKRLGLDIPSTWYADRYLEQHAAATKELRKEATAFRNTIKRAQEVKKKLLFTNHPTKASPVDAMALLRTVINGCERRAERGEVVDRDGDVRMQSEAPESRPARIARRLRTILDKVRGKVEVLDQEIEDSRHCLDQLSSMLKDSNFSPAEPPKLRYALRGIVTDAHTTFTVNPHFPADRKEWTKIVYRTTPSVEEEGVTEEEAIRTAREEGRTVMLVYAMDEALEPRDVDLPKPLQAFLKKDNDAFDEELNGGIPMPSESGHDVSGGSQDSQQAPRNSPDGDADSGFEMG